MIELHIDNVYVEVKYASNDIEFKIWDKLAFEIKEYNPLALPQIRHLFSRKTKKSYTGLLDYIIDILKENNEEYIIVDKRIAWKPNADYALVKYLDKERTQELKVRDYQQRIIDNCRPRDIIQAATSSGKQIPLSEDILTINGWKKMRDIHSGDIVFDEDGAPTQVLWESPIRYADEYEITFKDNTKVRCCKDHLWKYTTKSSQFSIDEYKVAATEELIKYDVSLINDKKINYNIAIPINKPVQFNKKDLLVPPYLLGLLLGNGNFDKDITFVNSENDLIEKIKHLTIDNNLGEFVIDQEHLSQYIYIDTNSSKLKDYIKNTFGCCLAKDKFIPEEYKYSSIEDRLELVRGLIDTNGKINKMARIRFRTNSKQLAEDFKFLIYSLGYRVKLRVNNYMYIIYIYTNDDLLFTSKKHKKKFNQRKIFNKKHEYDILKIKSIQKLNTKTEMKCITVDSPKHTYICSKNFIVTHNTFIMAGLIAKFNVKPVSIFADKISLCTQLKKEFEKFLGEPVGLVGGGVRDVQDITVFSTQSATQEMVKDTKLLLVDECHHLPCNTLNEISKWCTDAYYRVGVSATPWRDDSSDLLIDAVCNRARPEMKVTASELIQQGYITPCQIYWVKQNQEFKGTNYTYVYRDAIVTNNDRNINIVKIAYQMRKAKNATILILVQRVEHGEILLRLLQRYISNKSFIVESTGMGAKTVSVRINEIEFLSGTDTPLKRNAVLQAVRERQCNILLATTIFDEGMDVPSIDTVILAGAGKSTTRALQRIGRALRKYEGKDHACIFDFRDSTPIFLRQARVRNNLYKSEPAFKIKTFPAELLNFDLVPVS